MNESVASQYIVSAKGAELEHIDACFFANVARFGGHTAICDRTEEITYLGLSEKVEQFASVLRDHGVEPGETVAIDLPRSVELVVCMLGVLTAGATYVAMGHNWNRDRKNEAARISRATRWIEHCPSDITACCSKIENLAARKVSRTRRLDGRDPACIFLTSGTSGDPKAVLTPHRAITRLFHAGSPLAFGPEVRMGVAVSPAWDAFALELYTPLLCGGTALLCPDAYWHPLAIRESTAKQGLNTLWLTASLFNLAIEEQVECFAGLQTLIIGGERLSVRHVRRFLDRHPNIALWNGYGPVETCIFATMHRIVSDDCSNPAGIPLGRPIAGSSIAIRPDHLNPACGEYGEICIGGNGLSLGYLGNSTLNKKNFVRTHARGRSETVYLTGDRGFIDNEGILHFVDRLDRQVKLRGVRIDLEEVERMIEKLFPQLDGCRALIKEDEAGNAVAITLFCVAAAGKEISVEAIRAGLGKAPLASEAPVQGIHLIESIPVTENGKLDEQRLWEIAESVGETYTMEEPSRDNGEATQLLRMIGDIVGQPYLDIDADLIASGLDSMGAARLAARLSAHSQGRISFSDVVAATTPRFLLQLLQHDDVKESAAIVSRPALLSPAMQGFLYHTLINPADTGCHCLMIWSAPPGISRRDFHRAMAIAQRRHPILVSKFDGEQRDADGQGEDDLAAAPPKLFDVEPKDDVCNAVEAVRQALLAPFNLAHGHIWHGAYHPGTSSDFVVFGCAIHHIAFDAASEQVLARTIERALRLEKLPSVGTATWPQQRQLVATASGGLRHASALSSVRPIEWPQVPELPCHERSPNSRLWALDCGTVNRLTKLAQQQNMLPIALYLGALGRAVGDVTGQSEMVISVPVDPPVPFDPAQPVGCRISLAFAIIDLAKVGLPSDGGLETAIVAWKAWQEALSNVDVALLPSPDWVKSGGTGRRFPAQLLFALQPGFNNDLALPGGMGRFHRCMPDDALMDLAFEAWPCSDGGIKGYALHDPTMLGGDTVTHLTDRFVNFLIELAKIKPDA